MNELHHATDLENTVITDNGGEGAKLKRKRRTKAAEPASDKPTETKADRFRRLANRRVRKAVQYIGYVANLGNKASYEYNGEQVNRIISALEKALDTVTVAFTTQRERREEFEL
jgi:hypothetical protein